MPKLEAFVSGAWRTPARGEVFIGGAWRRVTRAESYRGSGWVSIASFIPPLSLSLSPPSVSGGASPNKPSVQTVMTNYVTARPAGGSAPYSYSWSAPGTAPTNPTNAVTAFVATLAPEQEITGTATVTCTDANGNTAVGQCDYYLYNQSNQ